MQPRGWIWNHPKSENLRMKDFLSASQRSCLKSAHRMERDRKIGDRMRVVLLADQGESFAEIAKFLFIDEQTACRHLRDYFDNGKTGGSSGGTEGKSTQEQAARLRAILATCDVPAAQTAASKTTCPRAKWSFSWMPHTPPWPLNWATAGRSKVREKSLRQRLEKNGST